MAGYMVLRILAVSGTLSIIRLTCLPPPNFCQGVFAMSRSVLLLIGCLVIPSALAAQEPRKIEFNRDIRPILSNNCFVCHGPDNNLRKAKLRLDDEKDAHAKVIVAEQPLVSEM